MALGSVGSGILNEATGLRSDFADLKTDFKGLKHAKKKFNARKVFSFSTFTRLLQTKTKSTESTKRFSHGSWKVSKTPNQQIRKQLQNPQSTKTTSAAGNRTKNPQTFTDTPRGLAELRRQNQSATPKAAPQPAASLSQSKGPSKAQNTFSTMGEFVLKLKTPKQALEFKKTLKHHAARGFTEKQTATLQKQLTAQLKKMAFDKRQAHHLTNEALNQLVSKEDRKAIIEIRNKSSESIESLEARLRTLKGLDNLPTKEQIQQRLHKLKGLDKLPSDEQLQQRLDDLRRR